MLSTDTASQVAQDYQVQSEPYMSFRSRFTTSSLSSVNKSTLERRWAAALETVHAMYSLEADWDGNGCAAPDPLLVMSATYFLSQLKNTMHPPPSRVVPSPTGGVLIEWHQDQVYTEAEIAVPFRCEWMQIRSDQKATHWIDEWAPQIEPSSSRVMTNV